MPIYIYTDHRTLENFDQQKDLSRRQAHWQEFLAQYNHHIIYIPGKSNTVADALSRLPDSVDDHVILPVTTSLLIQSNPSILESIKTGYDTDPFCTKVFNANKSIDGIVWQNGLLYIGNRLVIPRTRTLREDLF